MQILRTILIRFTTCVPVAALLLASSQALAAPAHRYRVDVDRDLSTATVTARFATPVTRVRAAGSSAGRYLSFASACGDASRLRPRGRRLSLPAPARECLNYQVDLAAAARDESRNRVLGDGNRIVSPSQWLWLPQDATRSGIDVEVEIAVAGGRVSVPWQPLGHGDDGAERFRIPASPASAPAIAVFGRFHAVEKAVGDASLRVAVLDPGRRIDAEGIADWVAATARQILLSYGRFPNPSPQIVVTPVGRSSWSSDRPVPFGRVVRNGGESIELFVNENRRTRDYYGDWTATHEFTHLMMPYIRSRDRWISEGFASYYQNVLMARAGIYDEREAWQKIHDGLERGRRSRPGLSPSEASAERSRGATMKIYWSGAALAMLADIELRRRSDGRESLDTVLARLERCCLPSATTWSAGRLFAELDRLAGDPVFMPLYRRHADRRGFPDTRAAFEELGIVVRRDRVRLDETAPLAGLRRAILSAPPEG